VKFGTFSTGVATGLTDLKKPDRIEPKKKLDRIEVFQKLDRIGSDQKNAIQSDSVQSNLIKFCRMFIRETFKKIRKFRKVPKIRFVVYCLRTYVDIDQNSQSKLFF
jgi:hypothetical protein